MSDPDASTYDKEVLHFYESKLVSQTRKRQKKCPGCEQDKTFESKDGYLVYSCGGRSGKCGPQTKIKLARYIYYPEMIRDTNKVIQNTHDPKLFTGLLPQDELDEELDFLKSIKELKLSSVSKYRSQNKLSEKSKDINKLHHTRLHNKKQQIQLVDKIKQQEDPEKRKVLVEEYLEMVKKTSQDYMDLQKRIQTINPFILVKRGSVKKLN